MLRVENLAKAFHDESRSGRVFAVDHIDLQVDEGEFFTLLGPSGCGKTTTLRCIAGLESPDAGEIVVDDRVMYSGTRKVAVPANDRNLGMVFQSYAIWPHMNVFDNVAFPLRVGKRRRTSKAEVTERVERALAVVELDQLAGRFATKLSGGQQQRLALARALVIEPALLLLDEPLSNLDAKLRESLRFELKRLQREQGITTVYVTHDQSEALSMSNKVAVMHDGKVSQVGDPFEIYLHPANAFVADFVGTTNFIEGVVEHRDGEAWRVRTPDGHVMVGKVVDTEPGDRCMVSIRPEHIEVSPGAGIGLNTFAGEIRTRLFTGEAMMYQVQLGSAQLSCRTPAALRYPSGTPVSVHLPTRHAIALPWTQDRAMAAAS
ncbi:ABC transporter ATP-binding protein [Actinotalea sp. Marseille-Q4924]|uniref:ABC transporter ATP-binding protein n=1 Tax=Actinotalea sp. Marseille-Q4924 TaxID=2866571 RepID=UPI001CE410A9|nr:ABC transporter ATP-binding protein [Actinotalea sp. Marseille-Q4924]